MCVHRDYMTGGNERGYNKMSSLLGPKKDSRAPVVMEIAMAMYAEGCMEAAYIHEHPIGSTS